MVDKIDRPNPPEPWTITAAAQTRDRGQRQGPPHREQDDEYSSPGSSDLGWQKFHGPSDARRIINIERTDIKHLWFRKAVIQRQSALVECDMELGNGRLYRGAQFLLPRLDDYFQFKGYIMGQEVPITGLLHDPITEVSIPLPKAEPAPPTERPPRTTATETPALTAWWNLWDATTQQLRPLAILLYSVIALVVMSVVLLLV